MQLRDRNSVLAKATLVIGILAALPVVTFGQGNDPRILTTPDAITFLQPITDIDNVQPCGAETSFCQFDFSNTTGAIIDSLTFDVTFSGPAPDGPNDYEVSDPNIPASDHCGGYFLICGATVSGDTVVFSFSGVNPADGDETPGQPNYDQEIGEQEGIPPLGDFFIDLEGWTDNTSSGGPNYYAVSFQNSYTTVPEASSLLILLTEFVLLAGVAVLFRRKLNWKRFIG